VGPTITAVIAAMAFVTVATSFMLLRAIDQLKVNGPLYHEIRRGTDLTADILPPPLYIIESLLTLHELRATQDDTTRQALRSRIGKLAVEFAEREKYWNGQALLRPDLRRVLDGDVIPTGRHFFAEVNGRTLPALLGTDPGAADAAMQAARDAYQRHRVAVDELVKLAAAAVEAAESAAVASAARTDMAIRLILLLVALATVVAGVVMTHRIARPIRSLATAMQRLAAGDTDVKVPGVGRRDELGEAASAVMVFRQSMVANTQMQAERESSRAAADASKNESLRAMADAIEQEAGTSIARIREVTEHTAKAAQIMATASERSQSNAEAASTSSSAALSTAETVADAAQELSTSIDEITRQVTGSTRVAANAVAAGEAARHSIDALTQRARQIGAVTKIIADIAERTNLLALNATIEAARAGEMGRGFAVVAGEVKALAAQTTRATNEISAQLGSVRAAADEAADAGLRIVAAIGEIEAMSSSIAAAVEQQGAATAAIVGNVMATAEASRSAAERTGAVSADAGEVGVHARAVFVATEGLNGAVGGWRAAVIRTANGNTRSGPSHRGAKAIAHASQIEHRRRCRHLRSGREHFHRWRHGQRLSDPGGGNSGPVTAWSARPPLPGAAHQKGWHRKPAFPAGRDDVGHHHEPQTPGGPPGRLRQHLPLMRARARECHSLVAYWQARHSS